MNWKFRMLALAMAVLMALPAFALAEEPAEVEAEPFEAYVSEAGEIALDAFEAEEDGAAEEAVPALDDVSLEELIGEITGAEEAADAEDEVRMGLPVLSGSDSGAPVPQSYVTTGVITKNTKITDPLNVHDTLQLDMGDQTVKSFKTSSKKIATVSSTGLITAQGKGSATITVTLSKKKKLTVKVKVLDPYEPTGIELTAGTAGTIYLGYPATLETVLYPYYAETKLTWKTSNKKVLKVDSTGKITPVKAGTAKITVQTANKRKATIKVTVKKNKVDGIAAKPTKAEVKATAAGTFQLRLKSVEILANGKMVCEIYLLNGLGKAKQLRDLDVDIYLVSGDSAALVASHTFSKVGVSCKKNTCKLFKVTIPKADVEQLYGENLPLYLFDSSNFGMDWSATLRYTK